MLPNNSIKLNYLSCFVGKNRKKLVGITADVQGNTKFSENVDILGRLCVNNAIIDNIYLNNDCNKFDYPLLNFSEQRLILNDEKKRIISDDGRSKVYDAIVDSSGIGDYVLLSDAINAGNKRIFIRNGEYNENSQIILTGGENIIGEDTLKTRIIFEELTGSAIESLNNNIESNGTISIDNNTRRVNGVNTAFMNLKAGDKIILDQVSYLIDDIISDTSLDIVETYNGSNISNMSYLSGEFIDTCIITNITISNKSNNTLDAINISGIQRIELYNLFIDSFNKNICINESNMVISQNIITRNSMGTGLIINYCISVKLIAIASFNNIGSGIQINNSRGIIFDECLSSNNTEDGIEIIGSSTIINITNSQIGYNNSSGIRSVNSTNNIIIDQCNINQNNIGIDFSGKNNIITSSIIINSNLYGIKSGDNGLIVGCNISSNGASGIDMQNDSLNVITGNTISDNINAGISMTGGSEKDNTFTGNIIYNNITYGININETGNSGRHIISGNIIRSNNGMGSIGIRINGNSNNINGNRISEHRTGILIENGANDNLIATNHLLDNTTTLIDNGTNNTITSNKES